MANKTSELPLFVTIDDEHIQHIVNPNVELDTEKDGRVTTLTLKNYYQDGLPTTESVNSQINTALSGYVTSTYYNANRYNAGTGILISGNTISVTGFTSSGQTFDTSLDYDFSGNISLQNPLISYSPMAFIETRDPLNPTGYTFQLGFRNTYLASSGESKYALFGINEDNDPFLMIDDKQLIWRTSGYVNFSGGTGSISALTWNQITNKPTTISGYGITDAYTKNEVNNLLLTGGTGISVTGQTINLNVFSDNGSTTGIYQQVDVNNRYSVNLNFDALTEESANSVQTTDYFAFTRSGVPYSYRYARLRNQLNQQILLNYVVSGNTGNISSSDSLNTALNKLQNGITGNTVSLSGYVTTNTAQNITGNKTFAGSSYSTYTENGLLYVKNNAFPTENALLSHATLIFSPATGLTSQVGAVYNKNLIQFTKTNQSNPNVSGFITVQPPQNLHQLSSASTVSYTLTLPLENSIIATQDYVSSRISGLTSGSTSTGYTAGYGITISSNTISVNNEDILTDFAVQKFTDDLSTFIAWENGNSGTGAARTSTVQANRLGIHVLQAGTTSSGRSYNKLNNNFGSNAFTLGYKRLQLGFVFQIPTLSTSAETFTTRVGLANSDVGASVSRGLFLEYQYNQNSGNFRIGTGSGSTVYTNTSVVVSAGTWYSVSYDINALGNSAVVNITNQTTNITTSYTITASLPLYTSLACQPYFVIEKSNGTSNRELWCDWYGHRWFQT